MYRIIEKCFDYRFRVIIHHRFKSGIFYTPPREKWCYTYKGFSKEMEYFNSAYNEYEIICIEIRHLDFKDFLFYYVRDVFEGEEDSIKNIMPNMRIKFHPRKRNKPKLLKYIPRINMIAVRDIWNSLNW